MICLYLLHGAVLLVSSMLVLDSTHQTLKNISPLIPGAEGVQGPFDVLDEVLILENLLCLSRNHIAGTLEIKIPYNLQVQ